MRIVLRLIGAIFALAIVGLLLFAGYVAIALGLIDIPGLSDLVRGSDRPPVVAANPSAVRELEQRLGEAGSADFFSLELSARDLNILIADQLSKAPVENIESVSVTLGDGTLILTGTLRGTIPVSFGATAAVTLEEGQGKIELEEITIGPIPLLGAAEALVGPLISDFTDLNRILGEGTSAVVLEELSITPERVLVAGERRPAVEVPSSAAPSGQRGAPPTLWREVPEGRTADSLGDRVVIGIGDSLTASVGASRPELGHLPRFHRYLEEKLGSSLGLRNFGVSGETSGTLLSGGQMGRAVALLRQLEGDGDPNTEAVAVVITIGANDINRVLVSQECQTDPAGEACRKKISAALDRFETRFPAILAELRDATSDTTPIYIVNYYNPFNLGTGLPFEQFSENSVGRLNEILARSAAADHVSIADAHKAIGAGAAILTRILSADIHPNDEGYAFMAAALMDAADANQ